MSKDLDRAYSQMKQLKVESLVDDSLNKHFIQVHCDSLTIKPKSEDEDCSKYDTTKDILEFKLVDSSYHDYMYQLDIQARAEADRVAWRDELVGEVDKKLLAHKKHHVK